MQYFIQIAQMVDRAVFVLTILLYNITYKITPNKALLYRNINKKLLLHNMALLWKKMNKQYSKENLRNEKFALLRFFILSY